MMEKQERRLVVLRNSSTRKDAVYAVQVVSFVSSETGREFFEVYGYWGRWSAYEDGSLGALQSQDKAHTSSLSIAMSAAYDLVFQKRQRGYAVVATYGEALTRLMSKGPKSASAPASIPTPTPAPAPMITPEAEKPTKANLWSVLEI